MLYSGRRAAVRVSSVGLLAPLPGGAGAGAGNKGTIIHLMYLNIQILGKVMSMVMIFEDCPAYLREKPRCFWFQFCFLSFQCLL